jgi:hypothetical protein
MTSANYEAMGLDELRQYILTHREDIQAFYIRVKEQALYLYPFPLTPSPMFANNS